MDKKKSFKPWVILWTATGINFIAGLLYIWSVISKGLITEFHWTSKQASMPYTVATVAFVVSMAVFGKVQDIKGPRFTASIASVLMGGGLILSGFTTNPAIMVITFGIVTGAGIGMINISTTPPAVKWFSKEKNGLVTGVVVGGIGLASVLYSPLMHFLINAVGISKSFIYIGVGALVLSLLLTQLLGNPPEGYVPESDSSGKSKKKVSYSTGRELNWRYMLKSANFYKLWVMFVFSASAGLMIIGHAATIAKIQVNWEGGYILVILLAIFNTLGRLLGGSISDYIGRINLMRIIFAAQAVNMLLFMTYKSLPLLAIGVAVAGMCYGAGFSVFPATTLDYYGNKNFGANYGLMFTAWGVGGVIGPMMAAAIVDATKTYNTAYFVACALMFVSFIISLTCKNRVSKNNDTAVSSDNL